MEIIFLPDADEDFAYWIKTGNKQVLKKISELIASIIESPFAGIGKPEPLKWGQGSRWSRRINQEHRIVYEVQEEKIYIVSLRGHYE